AAAQAAPQPSRAEAKTQPEPKPAPPSQSVPVQGMQLVERKPPAAALVPVLSWLAAGIALAGAVLGGALSARRRASAAPRFRNPTKPH
ncbi:hypothetical protein, partial [Cupriavidus basilensis]|uniref:hypothetical protein n=1 Tax=Cupriavidus basilensis TaxID=68895 RepID=UPI0023E7682A